VVHAGATAIVVADLRAVKRTSNSVLFSNKYDDVSISYANDHCEIGSYLMVREEERLLSISCHPQHQRVRLLHVHFESLRVSR
jgi:hypothetical protein